MVLRFSRPFLKPLLPFGSSLISTPIMRCNLGKFGTTKEPPQRAKGNRCECRYWWRSYYARVGFKPMDLMRQLEAEHKRLWENLSPLKPEMVAASDCVHLVLLSGWTDRDISLWDVSGLDGKPGLQDILVALCRKKKDWDKISYLRFPKETVSKAGLSLTASNGNTGDQKEDRYSTYSFRDQKHHWKRTLYAVIPGV